MKSWGLWSSRTSTLKSVTLVLGPGCEDWGQADPKREVPVTEGRELAAVLDGRLDDRLVGEVVDAATYAPTGDAVRDAVMRVVEFAEEDPTATREALWALRGDAGALEGLEQGLPLSAPNGDACARRRDSARQHRAGLGAAGPARAHAGADALAGGRLVGPLGGLAAREEDLELAVLRRPRLARSRGRRRRTPCPPRRRSRSAPRPSRAAGGTGSGRRPRRSRRRGSASSMPSK